MLKTATTSQQFYQLADLKFDSDQEITIYPIALDYLSGTLRPYTNQNSRHLPSAGANIKQVYDQVDEYRARLEADGYLEKKFRYKSDRYMKPKYRRFYIFPIDKHLTGASMLTIGTYPVAKDNSIWIELNPMPRTKFDIRRARKHLIGALGKRIALTIYSELKLTRIDIAIDIAPLVYGKYIFDFSGVRKASIDFEDGGIAEMTFGSMTSDNSLRIYDKNLEQRKRKKNYRYPAKTLRFEFVLKDLRLAIADLNSIPNPIRRLHCYSPQQIKNELGLKFYRTCRKMPLRTHLQKIHKTDPNAVRVVKRKLEPLRIDLFDRELHWNLLLESVSMFDPLKPKN